MSNIGNVKAERIAEMGVTVWHEFTPLSQKHQSVNLGQGFPNFEPPKYVLEALRDAVLDKDHKNINQYTRVSGHLRLVNDLAKFYSPLLGRQLDPLKEILVTFGATEALFCIITSLINPGDEIVLIEPFFDIYIGAVQIANGIPKYVPLRPKSETTTSSADWILDIKEFEAAFSDKTKLIILNNPQNPTGKVFSKQELEQIAEVIKKFPKVIVISDEVYEFMVYDNQEITRFATLPSMWERTLTIGSAGKTFSVTGWKTGWIFAPAKFIEAAGLVKQFTTFCSGTPFQEAIAIGFEDHEKYNYFNEFSVMLQKKRDKLVNTLSRVGLTPVICQGSYFLLVNTKNVKIDEEIARKVTLTGQGLDLHDWNVCRFLTTEVGVTAIPPSAFYCKEHQHLVAGYARFCFCKTDDMLDEADKRLTKLLQNK